MSPRRSSVLLTLAACLAWGPVEVSGQKLFVGVIGGTALTRDLRTLYQPVVVPGSPFRFDVEESGGRSVIAGATVEWNFSGPLSVEADGIYRRLKGANPTGPFKVVTWEFPILAKYRLDLGDWKPFVTAGPSFRTAGNLNTSDPSHFGMTAGLGFDAAIHRVKISPTVRYTRWAADKVDNRSQTETLRNQVELLVGLSPSTFSNLRPLGRRVSLGVMLGTNLTSDFRTRTFGSTTISRGPRSFIVGPTIEARVNEQLSVEASALHRPLRQVGSTTFPDGAHYDTVSTSPTWQFPVLAKYKLPLDVGDVRPFVEGGPSFRLTQVLLAGQSAVGLTAGAGAEGPWEDVTFAPRLRYTRRAQSPGSDEVSTRGKLDFLLGVTF